MPRRILCAVILAVSSTYGFSQSDNVSSPLDASLRQFARAISPGNDQQAEILYLQSRIKQRFGDHNAARELAEAAVEANPKRAAYRLQLASVLSDDLDNGSLFKKMSIAKRIHRQLDNAVKLEPRNPDCLFGMMIYYEQAPGVLGGSRDKAHQLAEQIGRINRSEGYLAEAQLAQMENRSGELEDLYLKAVEADPISFNALASLAGFYGSEAQKKKYELANRYAWVLDLTRK